MSSGSGNVSDVVAIGNVEEIGQTSTPSIFMPTTNPHSLFALYCSPGSVSDGHFYPFYKNGTAYSLASNRYFHVLAIMFEDHGTQDGGQLCTATAAITAGASTLTGGVYQTGVSANSVSGSYAFESSLVASGKPRTYNIPWTMGSASTTVYAGAQFQGSTVVHCIVIGYEDANSGP